MFEHSRSQETNKRENNNRKRAVVGFTYKIVHQVKGSILTMEAAMIRKSLVVHVHEEEAVNWRGNVRTKSDCCKKSYDGQSYFYKNHFQETN